MKQVILVTLTIGFLNAGTCLGGDVSPDQIKKAIRAVPAAELPARVAELVRGAKGRSRAAVAREAVQAGLELNPALAPTLVSSIAKAAPEMSAMAAAVAAQQQPNLAPQIARAAAAAAPNQLGKIIIAVCRAAPADYRRIALAVAQVAPGSAREILKALASAIPELKPGIQASLANYHNNPPSVSAVLDSPELVNVARSVARTPGFGSDPRGPTIAPPYVPYSGSSSGMTPSDTGPVPRGGRDYAAP